MLFVCGAHVHNRNVMLSDDGKTPILMDFGSTVKARVPVENRSQALLQQVSRKTGARSPPILTIGL